MRYELPAAPDRPIWDTWLSRYRAPAMAAAEEAGIFGALAAALAGGAYFLACVLNAHRIDSRVKLFGSNRYRIGRQARRHRLPLPAGPPLANMIPAPLDNGSLPCRRSRTSPTY